MKLKIKHTISYSEADQLIELYYEGLTTGTEEKQLREFLSQRNLPERFEAEKAIFGYFANKKQKPVFCIHPFVRWASVAVLIIAVVSVELFSLKNEKNYAYINGKKITDLEIVKSFAENSFKDISNAASVNETYNLNSKEIMKQQLGAFSE